MRIYNDYIILRQTSGVYGRGAFGGVSVFGGVCVCVCGCMCLVWFVFHLLCFLMHDFIKQLQAAPDEVLADDRGGKDLGGCLSTERAQNLTNQEP